MQRWKNIALSHANETEKLEDVICLIKGINSDHDDMLLRFDSNFKAHIIRGTWKTKVVKGIQYNNVASGRSGNIGGDRYIHEIVKDDEDCRLVGALLGPFNSLLTEDERASFALKFFRNCTGTNMRDFLTTRDYSRTVYYRNQRKATEKMIAAWKIKNAGQNAPKGESTNAQMA